MNTEQRSPQNTKLHVNLARHHPRKNSVGAVIRLFVQYQLIFSRQLRDQFSPESFRINCRRLQQKRFNISKFVLNHMIRGRFILKSFRNAISLNLKITVLLHSIVLFHDKKDQKSSMNNRHTNTQKNCVNLSKVATVAWS